MAQTFAVTAGQTSSASTAPPVLWQEPSTIRLRVAVVTTPPSQTALGTVRVRTRSSSFVGASFNIFAPPRFVTALPGGHSLYRPIPVQITVEDDGEVTASFTEANIVMTGATVEDAVAAVAADIVDAFELFVAEEAGAGLGPGPRRQLRALRQHIKAA